MKLVIPALFLSFVLALFCPALQRALRNAIAARPTLLFLVPSILSGLFCGFAAALGALSVPLTALILGYTLAPSACAFLVRGSAPPVWADFAVILLLWLPLELSVGGQFIPRASQGLLHMAAYGVAVTLGLVIFLSFRRLDGMKYRLPTSLRDLVNPLIGFAAAAPVLIVVGLAVGFLELPHMPARLSVPGLGGEFLLILAATALPEEILFRALIQNSLMQKLGANNRTLLLAALIFGAAHLNNAPGPLPNWRYMIVAAIAGFAYGKVFEKSSSIFASAGLHALVNTVKHSFF